MKKCVFVGKKNEMKININSSCLNDGISKDEKIHFCGKSVSCEIQFSDHFSSFTASAKSEICKLLHDFLVCHPFHV